MDELQPNARALLDRARVAVSPSGDDVEALAARLGLPPSGGPAGGEPSPAPAGAGRLLLAVAAVAVLAAGAVAWTSSPSATRLAPALSSVPTLPEPPADDPSPPPPAPDEPPAPVAKPEPADPEPKVERKAKPEPRPAPVAQRDDLQAELALILRARRALKAGKDAEARTTARDYVDRFPRGAFEEEAHALELIASCNLGPTEALRDAARARLAGAFANRVRRACLQPE